MDILSHIAIRARNTGVFLASCSGAEEWKEILEAGGNIEAAKVCGDATTGDVFLEVVEASTLAAAAAASGDQSGAELKLEPPKKSKTWVLAPSEYKQGEAIAFLIAFLIAFDRISSDILQLLVLLESKVWLVARATTWGRCMRSPRTLPG